VRVSVGERSGVPDRDDAKFFSRFGFGLDRIARTLAYLPHVLTLPTQGTHDARLQLVDIPADRTLSLDFG
jgi:hypothetical protein